VGNPDNLTLTDFATTANANDMDRTDTIANIRQALAELDTKKLAVMISQFG